MKNSLMVLAIVTMVGAMIQVGWADNLPTKEKPLLLKLATHVLPTHFLMSKEILPEWAGQIEEETGGRVKIKIFDSQSMGKLPEEWDMLKSGMSDIGWIVFPFYRGVFPLSEIMSQPGLKPTEGQEIDYYNAMFEKYLKAEYSEVKAFFPTILGDTYLNTIQPLKNLDDLKGRQIRCGSSQKEWVQAIGGTPATMPPSELYTALERGIVDGVTFPMDAVKSYKLYEVAKYHTPMNLGMGMAVFAMNQKVWDKLPTDIQQVFTKLNPELQKKMIHACLDNAQKAIAIAEKNGSVVSALSDQDAAKLDTLTFPLAEAWAKEKDAKGLPGTEVFHYSKKLLNKN
ncbi:TRAP transporter substrate-binding protein [Desulfopila aestuarii]|uniref:TRAP-type C4-dicarboxylate transport system, substrate-binding protein n=1 Tax=Desulfopila aestuarii DSM 18488 TaxID=1121416 RepID=A0A1M7XY33_9BACT|nr:TRAP transporter substrate-binding protein [Desulfopila aestuarii]SHO43886.1 TRAP-type C4-dicarboxylate transport system, substrate-binding protein [Desulfopila aestuarii DSM 18488]